MKNVSNHLSNLSTRSCTKVKQPKYWSKPEVPYKQNLVINISDFNAFILMLALVTVLQLFWNTIIRDSFSLFSCPLYNQIQVNTSTTPFVCLLKCLCHYFSSHLWLLVLKNVYFSSWYISWGNQSKPKQKPSFSNLHHSFLFLFTDFNLLSNNSPLNLKLNQSLRGGIFWQHSYCSNNCRHDHK